MKLNHSVGSGRIWSAGSQGLRWPMSCCVTFMYKWEMTVLVELICFSPHSHSAGCPPALNDERVSEHCDPGGGGRTLPWTCPKHAESDPCCQHVLRSLRIHEEGPGRGRGGGEGKGKQKGIGRGMGLHLWGACMYKHIHISCCYTSAVHEVLELSCGWLLWAHVLGVWEKARCRKINDWKNRHFFIIFTSGSKYCWIWWGSFTFG